MKIILKRLVATLKHFPYETPYNARRNEMVTNELIDLVMQYLSHETQKSEDCYDIV